MPNIKKYLTAGLLAGAAAVGINILIYLILVWSGGTPVEGVVLISILVASLLPNLLAALAYYGLQRITDKARPVLTLGVTIFVLISILPHLGIGPPPSDALSLLPENFALITVPLHLVFGATAIFLMPRLIQPKPAA